MMTNKETNWVARGQSHLQAGELGPAIEAFEKAYALEQSSSINQQLVAALTLDQHYQQAYRYLVEALPAYVNEAAWWPLAFDVMLKSQHFIAARKLMTHLPAETAASYRQQIEQSEEEVLKTEAKQVQTLTKRVARLSELSLADQKRLLAEAQTLPYKAYLFVSQYLLVDPFSLPLTRVTILEELRQLAFDQSIPFLNLLGQEITVRPNALPGLSQDSRYQAIQTRLTENEQGLDPSLASLLRGQVNLLLLCIYPCLPTAIQDVDTWLQQVQTLLLTGQVSDLASEPQEQVRWRQAAVKALQELQDQ